MIYRLRGKYVRELWSHAYSVCSKYFWLDGFNTFASRLIISLIAHVCMWVEGVCSALSVSFFVHGMCQLFLPVHLLTSLSSHVYSEWGGYRSVNNILVLLVTLLHSLLPSHIPTGKGTILLSIRTRWCAQIRNWHRSGSHYKLLLAEPLFIEKEENQNHMCLKTWCILLPINITVYFCLLVVILCFR